LRGVADGQHRWGVEHGGGWRSGAQHLRHSFALKCYSVGKLLYEARFAHLADEELRDFRAQFGDTWQLVALLLGHRNPQTTMGAYLEPFRALDVEVLFQHAAGVPIAELLAAVWGDHPPGPHRPACATSAMT
jgi:hypothetical protein